MCILDGKQWVSEPGKVRKLWFVVESGVRPAVGSLDVMARSLDFVLSTMEKYQRDLDK